MIDYEHIYDTLDEMERAFQDGRYHTLAILFDHLKHRVKERVLYDLEEGEHGEKDSRGTESGEDQKRTGI